MIPDDLVVEARAAAVVAVRIAAPAVVHDAGALVVGVDKVVLVAGIDISAPKSGAQAEDVRFAGHAAELAVAGGAVSDRRAGHVGPVVARVSPIVIGASFVGDAGGGAALYVLPEKVRVDLVGGAVVEAGVLNADHLSFAGVAVQLQVVNVAQEFGSGDVVADLFLGIGLYESHVSPLRYLVSLAVRYERLHAGFQRVEELFHLFCADIFQRFFYRGKIFFSDGADLHGMVFLFAGGGNAGNSGSGIRHFVLRQIFTDVKQGKTLFQSGQFGFPRLDEIGVGRDVALNRDAEGFHLLAFLRRKVAKRLHDVDARAVRCRSANGSLQTVDSRSARIDGSLDKLDLAWIGEKG